jgi:predicted HicB family RNase H-like nuclease
MKDETKSAMFMVRMRPSVKAAAEEAAAADNRSLAGLMETLLIQYLRKQGYSFEERTR